MNLDDPFAPLLSTEQEFGIENFKRQVGGMSEDQTKELLLNLYQSLAVKEVVYRQMLGWADPAPSHPCGEENET